MNARNRLQRSREAREYRFHVFAEDGRPPKKSETECKVGRDLNIQHENLENYCFKSLTPTQYDLVLLAGSIAFADRSAKRQLMIEWSRHLTVIMPVHEPDRWRSKENIDSLCGTLRFVTGDDWQFEFVPRKKPSDLLGRQTKMPLAQPTLAVLPFSNGLDSFANYRFLNLKEPGANPIAVTTWNQSVAGRETDWLDENETPRLRRLKIPFHLGNLDHPEPTYRSRTFVFYTFAALAAHSSDAQRIVIPENGQGSLGPSLTTFGGEWPHRGSHPGFTERLAGFLRNLEGWSVSFEHPHLWSTKGQVLKMLRDHASLNGWEKTKSCVQGLRHVNLNGSAIQCGICTGCFLRRLALHSGGIDCSSERYLWNDLNASSIDEGILGNASRTTTANDRDIAVHAVLDHEAMARAIEASNSRSLTRVAYETAEATKESTGITLQKLKSLLSTHRQEWREFVQLLRPESWVRTIVTNS
jgi:7-cyano-7-deazaguanine synthase in queuosine biosynthesis